MASLPLGAERGSLSETAPWATLQQRRAAGLGPRRPLGFTRLRGSGSLAAGTADAFVPMHAIRPASRVAVLLVVLRGHLVAVEQHRLNHARLSRKGGSVRRFNGIPGMAQNFIDCDREQAFLLPPSLRDWLPADHLAWFVIEAVERLDLAAFYAAYRADGHGRAAYEPSMMVSLVLYAYATSERSSRGIERHCRQDIAYRVITGNRGA